MIESQMQCTSQNPDSPPTGSFSQLASGRWSAGVAEAGVAGSSSFFPSLPSVSCGCSCGLPSGPSDHSSSAPREPLGVLQRLHAGGGCGSSEAAHRLKKCALTRALTWSPTRLWAGREGLHACGPPGAAASTSTCQILETAGGWMGAQEVVGPALQSPEGRLRAPVQWLVPEDMVPKPSLYCLVTLLSSLQ